MVHILAANSLHHAVNSLTYSSKKQFRESYICSRKNWFNNAINLLQKGHLSKRKDLVVWHNLINKTILRHRSNNYQSCSVRVLTSFLRTKKACFSAVVYYRRIGAADIFQELLKSELLVLSVAKNRVSKRKRKT